MDAVLKRRKQLSQSKHSLIWAAINGFFVSLVAIDLKCSVIGRQFDSWLFRHVVVIFDVIITLILLANVGYDLWLWFWTKYLMTEIELTSSQMKAFGVKPNEIGFKERKPSEDKPTDGVHNWTIGSQNSPVFEMSCLSDLDRHSSLNSTQLSMGNMSAMSDSLTGPQSDLSMNTTSTSWEYSRRSTPLNTSNAESNSGFVRSRRSVNKSLNDSVITNRNELDDYLKKFELKEERFEELVDSEKRRQVNTATTGWGSPLADTQSVDETNQIGYQMAIDSPLRLNNTDLDSMTTSLSVSKAMDSLLTKLKITEPTLNQWVENIRKWLSQTIICRLVQQIDLINDTLVKSGHFEALIGEASLQTVRQIATIKKNLSSIETVIPFLELTPNQKYLVQRLRDLSKGGCIGKFIWNSGGSYGYKTWSEELVTDSAIVMHLFLTYMDLRLPSDPKSPEGKAFTNTYFKSMTGSAPKSAIYIVEAKQSPPHYKLFTEEDGIWELPIGRNNLFHAIIAFLDYIKNKQLGHLGRINLGASGVNILWVVDRDTSFI